MSPDNPFGIEGFPDPNDPRMQQMMAQLQQMMSQQSSSGPVNWDLARQLANQQIDADPMVDAKSRTAGDESLRLADLWLENATALPSGISTTVSWTRKDWVAHTVDTWKELAEPLAARMGDALNELVPEDMRSMLGPMSNLMKGLGSTLFGAQLGQAMAALSTQVMTSTEVGLPLGPEATAALVPANLAEYADGLEDIDIEEVRLYVSLREAAHHRLYGHVPWLRAHIIGGVEAYSQGIHIDTEAIESMTADLDFTDADAMRNIDLGELLRTSDTPQQQAAVARLEHMLALVGGWVSHVAAQAAGDRLPSLSKLTESARRRRATGGPAERTFEALVGMTLSPRKLREATALWDKITAERGVDGRDAVWSHPDLMPSPSDLDDPDAFAEHESDAGELDMSIFDQLAVNDPKPPREDDGKDDKDA